MSFNVQSIPNSYAELGEGPHWDIARQSLYYVDINGGKVFRYDYQEQKIYKAQIEGEELAAFIIPIEGSPDKFAVGCGRKIVGISWDGTAPICKVDRVLFEIEEGEKYNNNRINDGKCDPHGRLFAGTMNSDLSKVTRTGAFYRFDMNGSPTKLLDNIALSNGLTWNENTNKFYYIDTFDYNVKMYDYDFKTGVPSNPKTLYDLSGKKLFPDGMTIDSEGYLYIATFNDQSVHKIDPNTGKLIQRIEMPTKQITSVAFGGPKLDVLFVTTSSMNGQPPSAGNTFMITGLGATGLPMANLKV